MRRSLGIICTRILERGVSPLHVPGTGIARCSDCSPLAQKLQQVEAFAVALGARYFAIGFVYDNKVLV